MREGKFATSIQFPTSQANSVDLIIKSRDNKPSFAQIVREALTFYIEQKYPQFLK